MTTDPARSRSAQSPMEASLRHLGTQNHGDLLALIEHAINRPGGDTGRALAPLVRSTGHLEGWTDRERAAAVWRVIQEGIRDPDVSPTSQSRRRRALQAAFRLPDGEIHEPWGSSLTERFKQLKTLQAVFGRPSSTQPMEMAWTRGVRLLARHLDDRFSELQTEEDWSPYRARVPDWSSSDNRASDAERIYRDPLTDADVVFRKPSKGAQPVFANLFVTTVFMRRRSVYRRITERLITAQSDDVRYYTARGFAGETPRLSYVPVQALWGCKAEHMTPSEEGKPGATRLWFPRPLRIGEQAHFASEVIDNNITYERQWVDVDVDHYGISQGQLIYGSKLPVSGLTIRIRFDEDFLPDALWWYAELNERERYDRPPTGDRHFLRLTGADVQHTFTERPCQPRESYGIAFTWPR